MQNLVQMIMKNWGVQTDLSVINRQSLLLSLSAGLALLLAGCGGGSGGGGQQTELEALQIDKTLTEDSLGFEFNLGSNYAGEDNLEYEIVDDSQHGIVSIKDDVATYTPSAEYNGNDSLTYTVSFEDGNGPSSPATVSLTINPVNDTPILILIDDVSFDEDASQTITLSATDVDEDDLIYSVTGGIRITAEVEENRVTFSAAENSYGEETLTVKVSDGKGGEVEQDITVEVNSVNDAPVVTGLPEQKVIIREAGSVMLTGIMASDVDGDSLTFDISGNEHILTDYNSAESTLTLSDNKSMNMSSGGYHNETITLTVDDGQGNDNSSATYKIAVELQFSNDDLALNDSEGEKLSNIDFYENDVHSITLATGDSEVDSLQYYVSGGEKIVVEQIGNVLNFSSSGIAVGSQQSITETFTVLMSDGKSIAFKDLSVQMNFIDELPALPVESDTITFEEDDVTVDGSFQMIYLMDYGFPTHDPDGDEITYSVATTAVGIVVEITDGNLKITPDEHYNGDADIEIIAKDPQDNSASTTLSIAVTPVNDAPVFKDIGNQETDEDSVFTLDISSYPSDTEGGVTITATVDDNAIASVDEGVLTATPNDNFYGDIMVTLTASDGELSRETEFKLVVNHVADDYVSQINSDNIDEYDTILASFSVGQALDSHPFLLEFSKLQLFRVMDYGEDTEALSEHPVWEIDYDNSVAEWDSMLNEFNLRGYEAGHYKVMFEGESRIFLSAYSENGNVLLDNIELTDFGRNSQGIEDSVMEADLYLQQNKDFNFSAELFSLIDLDRREYDGLVPQADVDVESSVGADVSYNVANGLVVYTMTDAMIKSQIGVSDTLTITIDGTSYAININDDNGDIFNYYPEQNMISLTTSEVTAQLDGSHRLNVDNILNNYHPNPDDYDSESGEWISDFQLFLSPTPEAAYNETLDDDIFMVSEFLQEGDDPAVIDFDLSGAAVEWEKQAPGDPAYLTVKVSNDDGVTDVSYVYSLDPDIVDLNYFPSLSPDGVINKVWDEQDLEITLKSAELLLDIEADSPLISAASISYTSNDGVDMSIEGYDAAKFYQGDYVDTVGEVYYTNLNVNANDAGSYGNLSFDFGLNNNIHYLDGFWVALDGTVGAESLEAINGHTINCHVNQTSYIYAYGSCHDTQHWPGGSAFRLNFEGEDIHNHVSVFLGSDSGSFPDDLSDVQKNSLIETLVGTVYLHLDTNYSSVGWDTLTKRGYIDSFGKQEIDFTLSKDSLLELMKLEDSEMTLMLKVMDDKHLGFAMREMNLTLEDLGLVTLVGREPEWSSWSGDNAVTELLDEFSIVNHNDVNDVDDASDSDFIFLALDISDNVARGSEGEIQPIIMTGIEVVSTYYNFDNDGSLPGLDGSYEHYSSDNQLWTSFIATKDAQGVYTKHEGEIDQDDIYNGDYAFIIGFDANSFNELGGNGDLDADGELNDVILRVNYRDEVSGIEYSDEIEIHDTGWFNDEYELG